MGAADASPKIKVTVVFAAVGVTAASAMGGTLAYLTDHDAKANEIGFIVPGDDGLITLSEPTWESGTDAAGNSVKGKEYASRGILPGDTLAKDPTVHINAWQTIDGRPTTNSEPIYVFMRVVVPKTEIGNSGVQRTLFDYTTGPGWALIARNDAETDEDGKPVGVYVYAYTGNESDVATTTSSNVASREVMPKASTYDDNEKLGELFREVTYRDDIVVGTTPDIDRDVLVAAYAIQADNLGDDSTATIYRMASGEDVSAWVA